MARKVLGRGLSALISSAPAPAAAPAVPAAPAAPAIPAMPAGNDRWQELPLNLIDASPWQPRKEFDADKLAELADSLKTQGLVQPVVVRRRGERYELVAGERRLRAASLLEWEKLPAVVIEADDARMPELALVENLQRDDLNPLEIAAAYEALQRDYGLTHQQIAERLGISSRSQVTNLLRLLELPEEVKKLVAADRLSSTKARALLALTDPLSQIELGRRAAEEEWTVQILEKAIAARGGGKGAKARKTEKPTGPDRPAAPEAADLARRLSAHLGTKVTVQDEQGRGTIAIEYYSPEEAARLLEIMGLPLED